MTPFKKYLPEDLTVVNIIKFLLPNLKIYIKRNIKNNVTNAHPACRQTTQRLPELGVGG